MNEIPEVCCCGRNTAGNTSLPDQMRRATVTPGDGNKRGIPCLLVDGELWVVIPSFIL
jgi:hypothetical protein